MNSEGPVKVREGNASSIGTRWRARASAATKPWLRVVSYVPLQWVRLGGLRLAQAKIGSDVVLAPGVEVQTPWRLSIGSHSNIGRNVRLDARGSLMIGNNVIISDDAAVWTAEHDIQAPDFLMTRAPVVIEDRVWICFRSIILPGVTLGEGCVVASGTIVTKDVSPFTVVGGSPARVICNRTTNLHYQLGRYKY